MTPDLNRHFWMAVATMCLSLFGTLVLALSSLETVFALFYPQPLGVSYRSEMSVPVHTPGFTFHRKEKEFEIRTTFNSLGLRDREYSTDKPDSTYRILVLGDSITAALEVADQEVYTEIVEASLNQPASATRYEVINAGISGFGQGDELRMFEYVGKELHPDFVLVQMSPVNDLSENLFCRWYEIADGKIQSLADVAPNFGIRLEEWLGSHSHFVQFLRGRLHGRVGDQAEYLQKTFEHKRKYHDYLFEGVGNEADFVEAWEVTWLYLNALHERASQIGAGFAVMIRPLDPDVTGTRTDPYPRNLIKDSCGRNGIPVLDLTDPFREKAGGNLYLLRFKEDSHWTPEGHRCAAEEVTEFLKRELPSGERP